MRRRPRRDYEREQAHTPMHVDRRSLSVIWTNPELDIHVVTKIIYNGFCSGHVVMRVVPLGIYSIVCII